MVVSHPSALFKRAEGTLEGAASRFVQVATSEEDAELGSASGNVGGILVENEKETSWITGNLTISF
jgi:hypothetical protein